VIPLPVTLQRPREIFGDFLEFPKLPEFPLLTPQPHPLEKIRINLSKSDVTKEKVVLITTGAFNPIHRMHVEMLEIAKKYLTNRFNYDVLAGLISPSHDLYVYGKLGTDFIVSTHRLNMCKLAIEGSDWLEVDPWEATQSAFNKFSYVCWYVNL